MTWSARGWLGLLVAGTLLGAGVSRSGTTSALSAQQAVDSLWAVRFTTGPGWQAEIAPGAQVGFASHSRNLTRLRNEGRILMGGRYGEVGLILIRAASAAEVHTMLAPDSSVAAGVFKADVSAWRTIYDGAVPRR